jgi:3-hydroxyacyl-[acyl-carrier-protein] dehydratase
LESQWSLLKEVKETDNNYIEALACVPADSPWFSGHFPGKPILPGIALIHLVKQAIILKTQKEGKQFKIHMLKRVRFMQPVWPGESLQISIKAEDADENVLFSFKVAKKENIVCSGVIAAEKMNK